MIFLGLVPILYCDRLFWVLFFSIDSQISVRSRKKGPILPSFSVLLGLLIIRF